MSPRWASLAWRGVGCASLLRAPRMTFFKCGGGPPPPAQTEEPRAASSPRPLLPHAPPVVASDASPGVTSRRRGYRPSEAFRNFSSSESVDRTSVAFSSMLALSVSIDFRN